MNDNLQYEGFFENYKEMIGRKGDFIFFDINGKKKYTLNYHSDDNFKIAQVWDVNNNEILKVGNGINILNDEEGIFYAYYKDSVEIWNKNYRQIQKDTVYIFALNGINPKPKNMSKFQDEVMKLIDFTEFKAAIRQPTRIYAKVIVDESGKLKDFQFKNITNNSGIITNIKCSCDYFKKWEAGSVNGEKKQFYFTIPFIIEP